VEGENTLNFQDYIFKTTQLQTQSLRPIHQITLDMEQLRLAQGICIARQFCELRQLCATRVDGLFFQPAKCQLAACKAAFENTTYADLDSVHIPPQSRGQKRLAEIQLQPNPSREKVYKFEMVTPQLEAKQRFDGTYDVPVVEGEISVEEDRPWVDHPEESALDLVLEHKNIFVQGLAGTGKSWLVKKLVRTLRERGERVQCCAFTHVAAKNIGGCTLHHFAHKYIFHGSFSGWVVIDEVGR
jgi:hypothetical protein